MTCATLRRLTTKLGKKETLRQALFLEIKNATSSEKLTSCSPASIADS
jgi:hypothetical protein